MTENDMAVGESGSTRPHVTDWQMTVESRVRRVRLDLSELDAVPGTDRERRAAAESLAMVEEILVGRTGFWGTLASWWSGWHIERAWRALHEAEVYVAAAAQDLAARLPGLRERASAYLPESDLRRQALEELVPARPPAPADRTVVVDALRAAFDASDDAHAGARALRNKLVGAAVVLVLLNVTVGLVGALHPGVIPMCLVEMEPGRSLVVCPTGGHHPNEGDVWLVQLLGAFGAVLSAVVLLIRRRPSLAPYVLSGYQALIKVLLGAALAVVGVLIFGAGLLHGLVCVATAPALLLWCVLLGYSQQVGTRLLDNYADRVMDGVRPLPEMPPNNR